MAIANELTINTNASAVEMAEAIFGDGIQVLDATYTGHAEASGIYSGADATMPGVAPSDAGVILSTGYAHYITNSDGSTNTNLATATGIDNGTPGDSDLTNLAGVQTHNAAVLEASFIPDGHFVTMRFVFSSEEYPEYVNQGVNDTFGVWVNGVYVPATISAGERISIDDVNDVSNQNLYIDNSGDQFNTEMDGFTVVLSFKAPVNPGVPNTIKIAVADGGDSVLDSNLMIAGDSLQSVLLAFDDSVTLPTGSERIVDVLANDQDLTGTGLRITQILGQDIQPGESIDLPTGERITLNPDGTLTILNGGDPGQSHSITYTLQDGAGNVDVGYLSITTPLSDGIVDGTADGDLIDETWVGDPDGDRIDNDDAVGVAGGTGHDDYIRAGAGDDTVLAGEGNDIAFLGDGDDQFGDANGADEVGDDTIHGEAGNDTIHAGSGDDQIFGGTGDDLIVAGPEYRPFAQYEVVEGGSGTVPGSNGNPAFDHATTTSSGPLDEVTVTLNGGWNMTGYHVGNGADANETHTHAFTQQVAGAEIALVDIDSAEHVVIWLDGVPWNLNDAISAGLATFEPGTTGAAIRPDGTIGSSGGPVSTPDPAVLVIHQPFTTLAVQNVSETGAGNGIVYSLAVDSNAPEYYGSDDDLAEGGEGNDTIYGGHGNDTLRGDAGDDQLFGGLGADSIEGGAGNDEIHVDGADSVFGGADRDTIHGGSNPGGAVVDGGEDGDDWDTLIVDNVAQIIAESAGSENGTVVFNDGSTLTYRNIEEIIADGTTWVAPVGGGPVDGTDGGDTMAPGYVDGDGDIIDGADGDDDEILAGAGDDLIYAGAGNDTVEGMDGHDVIYGGAGDDSIFGGNGGDQLHGGGHAGGGRDTLSGGAGSDTFVITPGGDHLVLVGGEDADDTDLLMLISETDTPVSVVFEGDEEGGFQFVGDPNGNGHFSEMEAVVTGTGNDTIDASLDGSGLRIFSNDGDDFVSGGSGNDVIEVGSGDDQVFAGDGDDSVVGGTGDDFLYGGAGRDTILGEDGDDTIQGDDGDDVVVGGAGNDNLRGDAGNDVVYGGEGDDWVSGGLDDDMVYGGVGNDSVFGGLGNDEVYGDEGNDSLAGMQGNDYLDGGIGDDTIYGGDGRDTLTGDQGADFLYGDADEDVFYGGGGDFVDGGETVSDGRDFDTLYVDDVASVVFDPGNRENGTVYFNDGQTLSFINIEALWSNGVQLTGMPPDGIVTGTMAGELIDHSYTGDPQGDMVDHGDAILAGAAPDDDIIEALGGNDTVLAGAGDDRVWAGAGNDSVDGGAGNDTIMGEGGDDTLNGDAGDDEIFGGQGDDSITGGEGDDSLHGGAGSDTIEGGDGDDLIHGGTGGVEGTTIWGSDGSGNLIRIDNIDGTPSTTLVGNMGVVMGDIGMHPDGTLYGVAMTYPTSLYVISKETGTPTLVGNMPPGTNTANGLTFGMDGSGYATGGNAVYKFDPSNPSNATLWWSNPSGGASTGDIAFREDKAYLAWSMPGGTTLIELTLDPSGTVMSSQALGLLPAATYGMTVGADGELYALGNTSAYRLEVPASPLSGGTGSIPATAVPGTVSPGSMYYGAASEYEGVWLAASDTADLLYGGAGDDTIYGELGNDTIYGGTENDLIYGGEGDDELHGDEGNDSIHGDEGHDKILGGDGNDTLHGDAGNDSLHGGAGNDLLYGGTGDDYLNGDAGDDTLYGGAGNDFVEGGSGNDVLFGGDGDDQLLGGDGNDVIHLDGGADTAFGGADRDTFIVGRDSDGSVVDGNEEGDDYDVLDLREWGPDNVRITYDPLNAENGTVEFLDDDGNTVGSLTFVNIEKVIPCFTPGSMVSTDRGEVAVEEIREGDLVLTRDGGYQPVRWVGRRDLGIAEVLASPQFAPIRMAAGSLGRGLPSRDMVVSPQHRMLIADHNTELLFGEHEVLVAASHLVGRAGVERLGPRAVSYIHLLLDRHEIIHVDGTWTESYQPGAASLPGEADPQRDELLALFPELANGRFWPAARMTLKRHEAGLLQLA